MWFSGSPVQPSASKLAALGGKGRKHLQRAQQQPPGYDLRCSLCHEEEGSQVPEGYGWHFWGQAGLGDSSFELNPEKIAINFSWPAIIWSFLQGSIFNSLLTKRHWIDIQVSWKSIPVYWHKTCIHSISIRADPHDDHLKINNFKGSTIIANLRGGTSSDTCEF